MTKRIKRPVCFGYYGLYSRRRADPCRKCEYTVQCKHAWTHDLVKRSYQEPETDNGKDDE